MGLDPINPMLLPIPESFESDRLLIRAPLPGDGAAVNEAMKESAEELRCWMPWAQTMPTIEQSELNIRRSQLQFMERSDLRLLLFHKNDAHFIGSSGLHRIDWQARKFEIGYWVRTSCSRQGFITEAVEAISQFAIDQLQANRIEIRCDARNVRSALVAERLQFTLEGTLRRDHCDPEGLLQDTLVFAKVRGIEF
ncbi:GNAT family N-acetyltransferase [Paenibacillus sp. GCM10027626]|uniref:GNAT family N-acetyltransferase n=1 Tax=Paenibacillus sp. GCM10027626 TaxID=3273411 RepID=UPI0036257520